MLPSIWSSMLLWPPFSYATVNQTEYGHHTHVVVVVVVIVGGIHRDLVVTQVRVSAGSLSGLACSLYKCAAL